MSAYRGTLEIVWAAAESLNVKALVKSKAEPGIWLAEEPMPEIGPDDVLVRVNKTGICGTDVHIFRWDEWARKTIPVPMVVGHEFAGEVVEVGAGVRGLEPGMRVSGEGHVIGRRSRASRAGKFHLDPETKGIGVNMPGAFAEYVRIPAFNAVALPDEVDDELGAILDPLGNAVHTALSFDLVGEDVLITGAGPIGIMAAAIARHVGARHRGDHGYQSDAAGAGGHGGRLRPGRCGPRGPQGCHRPAQDAGRFRRRLRDERRRGRLPPDDRQPPDGRTDGDAGAARKPFPVDWSKLVFKMLTIKCIYGREMFETWHKMLAMLQSGLDVRGVITHRLPASAYAEGFDLMDRGACGKIVLDWSAGPD